jgi:hypothetical protein
MLELDFLQDVVTSRTSRRGGDFIDRIKEMLEEVTTV